MSKLRIAVIGGGHLGRIHAKLIQQSSEFELVAVADPSHSARKLVTDSLGANTVSDYHVLAGSVDAVVIASPTTLHHSMASWALRHGLHTFVEKPLVHTTREAAQLVNLARDQGCTLQVGHVERFNPAWTAVQNHIADPRLIESSRTSTFTGRSTDIGVVLDLMIHDLDLVLRAANSQVANIEASGWSVMGQHEDVAEARITFQNGCIANLKASRVSPVATRTMNVHCRDATAMIDFATSAVDVITPCQEVAQGRFQAELLPPDERLALRDELFVKWLPMRRLEVKAVNAIDCELQDFAHAIRNDCDPQVTGEHGHESIIVAESILHAIRYRSAEMAPAYTAPLRRAA